LKFFFLTIPEVQLKVKQKRSRGFSCSLLEKKASTTHNFCIMERFVFLKKGKRVKK